MIGGGKESERYRVIVRVVYGGARARGTVTVRQVRKYQEMQEERFPHSNAYARNSVQREKMQMAKIVVARQSR